MFDGTVDAALVTVTEVAADGWRFDEPGEGSVQEGVRVASGSTAVDPSGNAAVVVGLVVPARCGQSEQGTRRAGYPAEPRPGRGEHQPPYPPSRPARELLRDHPAERHTEHVDPVVPEGVEHRLDGAGDAGHPAGYRIGG